MDSLAFGGKGKQFRDMTKVLEWDETKLRREDINN